MRVSVIHDALLKQHRERFVLDDMEALHGPIDGDRLYELFGDICDISAGSSSPSNDGSVYVTFSEPVPSARVTLRPGYTYTIGVSSDNVLPARSREGMPKRDLIALQQVAIIVWAMYTNNI